LTEVSGRIFNATALLLLYAMSALFLFVYAQELDSGAYHAGFFWWNLWFVIISTATLATLLLRGKPRIRAIAGVSAFWAATAICMIISLLEEVFTVREPPDVYQASTALVLGHVAIVAIPAATLFGALRRLNTRCESEENGQI
tara:strand:- start:283 stop:711 length:429 start_codon:yes stop_codon:yes gene_type:complete